jgi:large subunit ribosomal protein L31e
MNKKTKTESNFEREYIIPLRKSTNKVPSYKKANKAIKTIKEFLAKHMKVEDRDLNLVKIDKYLNETIWHQGIKHPPAKIKVKAIKENGIVRVEAVEMSTNLKFKKLRAEKVENQSKEVAKKKKSEKVEENVPEDKEAENKEDKKEEKEDKAATVEAEEKIEKTKAKEMKHTTNEKSPKEKKNLKVGYNKSSQGQ